VVDVAAVLVEAGGAVEHDPAGRFGAVAEHGPSGSAEAAPAAVGPEVEDDVVAWLAQRHARPDGLDDAGGFVAEDDRQRRPPLADHDVVVGVADAGGGHAHQDLALLRPVQLHLFDAEGRVGLIQDGGFDLHRVAPLSAGAVERADYRPTTAVVAAKLRLTGRESATSKF
jgi:hypothetical protein